MKKILNYAMCTSPSECDFDTYVCEKIKEGWQPFGDPFMMMGAAADYPEDLFSKLIIKDGVIPVFAQAMVKYAQ